MPQQKNAKKMGTVLTKSTHPLKQLRSNVSLPASYTELYTSGLLLPVRDQGQCGSCWAFSVTGVLGDRISIATKGVVKEQLAAQYLVSCDVDQFENQCEGTSNLASAYDHATGDTNEDDYGASPIQGIPRRSEVAYVSGTSGDIPSCDTLKGITNLYKFRQPIVTLCETDDESMRIVSKSDLEKNIIRMKQEIMENGSISAAYWVFDDLQSLTDFSKPYRAREGATKVGGHAIVIVGWGVDQGGEYWIIKNSWSEKWGINGYYYHYMRDGFEGGADTYNGMELGAHSALPDMSWFKGDSSGKPPSSRGVSPQPVTPPTNPFPVNPFNPQPVQPAVCPSCPVTTVRPVPTDKSLISDPWFWVSIIFGFLLLLIFLYIVYKIYKN